MSIRLRAVVALCAVLSLAGCGGHHAATTTTTASRGILTGDAETVTFGQLKRAIDDLYRSHPGIATFVVRDVEYTPRTRDQVLGVCHRGGAETDPTLRESARVLACAPLIFFFYEYGRHASAPAATALARKLYWYAARITGPFDPKPRLTALLGRWGVA